jgi:predicted DNA-binding protein (UPF0251 family)
MPDHKKYGPLDGLSEEEQIITMTIDEYETIRLIDLVGFTQEECSKQMNVARTTVQAIYNDARKKIAESIVNGAVLKIEGGEIRLCEGNETKCGRGCHKHRHGHGRGNGMD